MNADLRQRAQTEVNANLLKDTEGEKMKQVQKGPVITQDHDSSQDELEASNLEQADGVIETKDNDLIDRQDPIFYRLATQQESEQNSRANSCNCCGSQFGTLRSRKRICAFCGSSVCKDHIKKKRKDPQNEAEFHPICDRCEEKYLKSAVQAGFLEQRDKYMAEIEKQEKLHQEITIQIEQLQEVIKDQKKRQDQEAGETKQVQQSTLFRMAKANKEIEILKNKEKEFEESVRLGKQECEKCKLQNARDEESCREKDKKRYELEQQVEELEKQLHLRKVEIGKIREQRLKEQYVWMQH